MPPSALSHPGAASGHRRPVPFAGDAAVAQGERDGDPRHPRLARGLGALGGRPEGPGLQRAHGRIRQRVAPLFHLPRCADHGQVDLFDGRVFHRSRPPDADEGKDGALHARPVGGFGIARRPESCGRHLFLGRQLAVVAEVGACDAQGIRAVVARAGDHAQAHPRAHRRRGPVDHDRFEPPLRHHGSHQRLDGPGQLARLFERECTGASVALNLHGAGDPHAHFGRLADLRDAAAGLHARGHQGP